MTKQCSYEECNEEIADWQQMCPKHYAQVQQQKQQSAIQQPDAQKPVQPVEQQGQQQSYSPENQQVSPEPQQPQMIDITEEKQPVEPQMLPLDDLQGKDRLIIKQVAMKCAVEFLQQTPVEYNDYPEMVGQLRKLVVDMYRIIVEKNEQ